ncbi:MAG: hypothetical protein UT00_C0011G0022 [Parcubacteria group bacterium GW2011_GWA1_38_7]|nr:MAG: hypothetical protein UT00_C0011G0022 [Parcubacteria group bacterium GW2011_GWA1_38_7]
MKIVKLSSKGQLVIPAKYRKELNLKSGDEFILEKQNNAILLNPLKYKSLDSLFLAYKSKKYVSSKDIKDIKKEKFKNK